MRQVTGGGGGWKLPSSQTTARMPQQSRPSSCESMGEHMSNAEHDRRIDYIEFSVKSVPDAKRFYGNVFGWSFEDYGPDYASFSDGRLSGGFQTASKVEAGGPPVGLFSPALVGAESRVI